MKITTNKKQISLAVACALAMSFAASAVQAQAVPAKDAALVTDTRSQVWMSGTGLCWHSQFGPAPVDAVCNPQPVAQVAPRAAAPAPYVAPVVVAAVTPQPVYEKVTLDADALFDFDKSTLRPTGRDALDKFVKQIDGITPVKITSEGHTDRLGSNNYNQKLSEERAASVKSYLVSKGIDANNVQAFGKGETQPMTKSGDCTGGKSAKLISCLQPDRRVEIEITGSRLQK